MPSLFTKKTNKKSQAVEKKDTEVSKNKVASKNIKISTNKFFACQPLISEKATQGQGFNKYTFLVSQNANKPEVKKFIEHFYNVKVQDVNMGKKFFSPKAFRQKTFQKKPMKKAVVTLKEGHKIEFNI